MTTDETLEDRLRSKLKTGEISEHEFNELYSKFQDLNILSTRLQDKGKTRVSRSGSNRIDGGIINGPLTISGRVVVTGSLECQKLSISGFAKVEGDLTVIGKSSISGSVEVNGNAKFGDKVASSGSIVIESNLYTTTKLTISGKAEIKGDLIADGPVNLIGSLKSGNVKSTGMVKVMGEIEIFKDILAEKFEADSGVLKIVGNLKAKTVSIFPKIREATYETTPEGDIPTIGDMLSNVVGVLFPKILNTIVGVIDPYPEICEVNGDIVGEEIELNNTKVAGDVLGDNIIIGSNVEVDGQIKYKQTIIVPENTKYNILKL